MSIITSTRQRPPRAQVVFNSRAFRGIFIGWMCLIKLENEVDTWLMAHSLIRLSNVNFHTKIKPPAQPLLEGKAQVEGNSMISRECVCKLNCFEPLHIVCYSPVSVN